MAVVLCASHPAGRFLDKKQLPIRAEVPKVPDITFFEMPSDTQWTGNVDVIRTVFLFHARGIVAFERSFRRAIKVSWFMR